VSARILLADDSPHAQRMGERILIEEGFEVVTVTDGETALIRLADVDPDVILADVFLPLRSGYELCWHVKNHPRHAHVRVVLLAGLLEPVDEVEAQRVHADGVLKKPFEASVMVETVRPLAEAAQAARGGPVREVPAAPSAAEPLPAPPPEPSELDPERVRAAVTLALDRAMPALIDHLTERVLIALNVPRPDAGTERK
jgi:CheY-like chemotaxis protein